MARVAPSPEDVFRSYEQEIALLESAGRTGAPTQDQGSDFFGTPFDDFMRALHDLRDEIEARAYLAIVAAGEAMLQVDFRTRAGGKASMRLRSKARQMLRNEKTTNGRRIVVEDVLDAWTCLPEVRKAPIAEFKQLLPRRHWLAHGRFFVNRAPVPGDPGFAFERTRAMVDELRRIDPAFPST